MFPSSIQTNIKKRDDDENAKLDLNFDLRHDFLELSRRLLQS